MRRGLRPRPTPPTHLADRPTSPKQPLVSSPTKSIAELAYYFGDTPLGQSIWLDNITRELLDSGTLKRYIDDLSVTGLTSNPTIFDHAITHSKSYDSEIRQLVGTGLSGEALFFELAVQDLMRAADLFAPIHERTTTCPPPNTSAPPTGTISSPPPPSNEPNTTSPPPAQPAPHATKPPSYSSAAINSSTACAK